MIEEDDYDVKTYTTEQNYVDPDCQQQYMLVEEDDCMQRERDIYQQLAEKDHYLMLAAEAGKVLLEKNQELSDHYQDLQNEYFEKIQELEQERHHLRKELCNREYIYETRMQDLQEEVSNLSGQLQIVQKSSKSFELSNKSTFNDIVYQNDTLLKELDEVKTHNQGLAHQVQTLSKRIDGRVKSGHGSAHYDNMDSDMTNQDSIVNHNELNRTSENSFMEMKNLKEQVQKLNEHKQFLEASLTELTHEKEFITLDQRKTVSKVSTLEEELLNLKQQISMCQEDLDKTKRKNNQLNNQLEEYVMLQQSDRSGVNGLHNSLFNELEMSLSEADMNTQFMSTPYKLSPKSDDIDVPDIVVSPTSDQLSNEHDKLKEEVKLVYGKLRRLRDLLLNEHIREEDANQITIENIDVNTLHKLVDQVIELIRDRVLSLGVIDGRANSPTHLDLESCDNLSQPDSQISDRDVDILEQQVYDLNQKLNITTTELEGTRKDLTKSHALATHHEENALALKVQVNSQEREIDALRKERDIMMADLSLEEKLRKALEERDAALKRENDIKSKYETAQNDMQKLNGQLISVVQHKIELTEQLEQWQFDMASLIEQQLTTQMKKDQQRSRKRSANTTTTNPARMFAAKFFASKNSSKESSRTGTPTAKSPVPPKS